MPAPSLVGFEHRIVVGIADLAVSNNQNVVLTTYSLGSCLGIAIYDPVVKAGGLLHIMLPDSKIDTVKATKQPAMFVDTGVPALFRSAYQLGAEKHRVIIAVAGGAQIMDSGGFFNIGVRNYEALTNLFRQHSLKIHAEQVGGLVNRTMFLNLATGEVRLKISGEPKETILCKSSTTT
jgi:chemotaxis protein CheD